MRWHRRSVDGRVGSSRKWEGATTMCGRVAAEECQATNRVRREHDGEWRHRRVIGRRHGAQTRLRLSSGRSIATICQSTLPRRGRHPPGLVRNFRRGVEPYCVTRKVSLRTVEAVRRESGPGRPTAGSESFSRGRGRGASWFDGSLGEPLEPHT